MTSSKKNNWDKVMDGVNKALPTKAADNLVDGLKSLSGTILDPTLCRHCQRKLTQKEIWLFGRYCTTCWRLHGGN